MRRTPRSRHSAAGLCLVLMGAAITAAFAQDVVRVRGTIEAVSGGVYSVRTRDNALVKLALAPGAGVAASVRSSLADIRPGLYIGIAALSQADGSLHALEAHIFDESMRGTAEGHRAWDLLSKSTMTNPVVQEIVNAVDGHAVTLRYKDGHKQVLIPPGTIVVTYLPGSRDELKPGAVVFVAGANSQPDGTLLAQRVIVGRDVAPRSKRCGPKPMLLAVSLPSVVAGPTPAEGSCRELVPPRPRDGAHALHGPRHA